MPNQPHFIYVPKSQELFVNYVAEEDHINNLVSFETTMVEAPRDIQVTLSREYDMMNTKVHLNVKFRYQSSHKAEIHAAGWVSDDFGYTVLGQDYHLGGALNKLILLTKKQFRSRYPDAHEAVVEYFIGAVKACVNDILDGDGSGPVLEKFPPSQVSDVELAANKLPDIKVKVPGPAGSSIEGERIVLYDAIIQLNDRDRWSRERIADWIDELHDKGVINAEFEPWVDEESPVGYDGQDTKENANEQD